VSPRVLTWNLYHGRAVPPAGRELLAEFAAALAGWPWDIALLQEVPPWWPARLADGCGADHREVLTSRNWPLALRRALARRWPDVVKSQGGGCNAILVRDGVIVTERSRRLCLLPERRLLLAVALESGLWVGNLHATAHDDEAALEDAELARRTIVSWSAGGPIVLGGDFNQPELELQGFRHVAGRDVDHIFAKGLMPAVEAEVLERGALSDHLPLLATLSD
jgi:endonuclease/exonuclease/phosphatase family metal-dependent hydrolase